MRLLRAAAAAFAMYSRLPVPRVAWTGDVMAWALCCFPLVGIVVGAVLYLWLWLAAYLDFGGALTAAGAVLVPLAVTGGIHLDGLCDTADALASHQSRERKLEILKDSHLGAFGAMACALYLLLTFALWWEVDGGDRLPLCLCLVPVLSRGLSGLAAFTMPNARGSGLLCAFTAPADQNKGRVVMGAWAVLAGGAMVWADPLRGGAGVAAAAVVFVYYLVMSRRQFGGITGDLAGYFLQLCELGCLAAAAVAPCVWERLV